MIADYETFVRTVEQGGMSAAGRMMGLSPAVVSKRIARLEDRLGVRLIERTTRRLALTEAGRVFHDRAVAILDAADDLEAQISRRTAGARGLLRVSAPTSFGRRHLAPWLSRFTDDHPDLMLQLDLSDTFVDLNRDEADLAVRIGSFDPTDERQHFLCDNRRVLCAAPDYLARHGAPDDLTSLKTHRHLSADNQSVWRIQTPQGRIVLRSRSVVRTNSSEVVRELALAGMGVALRSLWDVGEDLQSGALEVVLPDWSGADASVFAITSERARHMPRVRAFIDFLKGLYSPTQPWEQA